MNKSTLLVAGLLAALLAFGLGAGIEVYAQGNATSTTPEVEPEVGGLPIGEGNLASAVAPFAGVFWGGLSYALKRVKTNPEKFDAANFLPTILLGMAIYGGAQALGLGIDDFGTLSVTTLLTILIDKFVIAPIQNASKARASGTIAKPPGT